MRAVDFKKEILFCETNKRDIGIHPYPAKMVSYIPAYFLSLEIKKPLVVFDPFCGSGTVLKEASKRGMTPLGVDINPLARLISKVETTPLNEITALKKLNEIRDIFHKVNFEKKYFPNIDYWFGKRSQKDLSKLKKAINEVSKGKYRNFFSVCFSAIIRKTSYADSRISPPVKSKKMIEKVEHGYKVDVLSSFEDQVKKMIRHLKQNNCKIEARIIGDDARNIRMPDSCIDIIITSPPYINAQKYFRSTQLELYWLDLVDNKKLKELDEKSIGTERVKVRDYKNFKLTDFRLINDIVKKYKDDKKVAYIILQYYNSMIKVIKELYRVLKKNGKLILVIGDNHIKGRVVPSGKIFDKILVETGFKIEKIYFDKIKNYSLMIKRNKTADIIKFEWILVARKN